MSWRTSKLVLLARDLGRTLGLNRLLASLRGETEYERRFRAAMLAVIRPGDVIWDVGANRGLYSRMFAELVGPEGVVFAFEPSPANLPELEQALADLTNTSIVAVALGESDEVVGFEEGPDPLGATSRVARDRRDDGDREHLAEVRLTTGDRLVKAGIVALPNVVKIDTEGFELDVLRGLEETLRHVGVRAVFVEMHFGLLKDNGRSDAPAAVESLLAASGYSLKWTDASHLVASRA